MTPAPPPLQRLDLRIALLAACVALVVYNANLRLIAAGDSYPARFIPFALWKHGTVLLDEVREATIQKHPQPYWIQTGREGEAASLYPGVTPVLVSPLYGPAVLYLERAGWSYENLSRVGAVMEKVASSCVASAAVFLMYLLLRRRLDRGDALLLTGAFAFGTPTWSVSSQALWQHGPAELLLVAALWFATGEPSRGNALAAGLATGLLAANRPPDVLLAAALALNALFWARRRTVLFALAAVVPVALVLAYNLATFGHLAGGYGTAGVASARFFTGSALAGVAGLLFSPAVGLFVFCPFLLFLPLLFHRSLRDRGYRRLTVLLAAAVIAQILLYAQADWRGGYTYGPRFLTDAVPAMVFLLAPVLPSLGRAARAVFVAGCLFAVAVQYIGAFHFSGRTFQATGGPYGMQQVWVPTNAGFLLEGSNPPQPPDLWFTLRSLARPVPPSAPAPPPPPRPTLAPALPPPTGRAAPRPPLPSEFYTLTPCVLVDTRAGGPLLPGQPPRIFDLAGAGAACPIPDRATAILVRVLVPEPAESGSIRLYPDGADGSWLEVVFGPQPRRVEVLLPLPVDGSGRVAAATTLRRAHLVLETGGYFAAD